MKELTDFLFKEVQDMKTEIITFKQTSDGHQKRNIIKDKMNDMESPKMDLRLYGLQEQEGVVVKQSVADNFSSHAGHWKRPTSPC